MIQKIKLTSGILLKPSFVSLSISRKFLRIEILGCDVGIRKDPFESARRRASLGGGSEERRRRLSLGEGSPTSHGPGRGRPSLTFS